MIYNHLRKNIQKLKKYPNNEERRKTQDLEKVNM